MEPVRVRLDEIIDFGVFVTFVGTDVDSDETVAVYVDRRPFIPFLQAWQGEGFPEPVSFETNRLILSIDVLLDDRCCDGAEI